MNRLSPGREPGAQSGAGLPTGTNSSCARVSKAYDDHMPPPPRAAVFGICHVSAPRSSPIGTVQKRHFSAPVAASNAMTRPRTPQSLPAKPMKTVPPQAMGALDRNSPTAGSPTLTFQRTRPESERSATRRPSGVPRNTRPSRYATPRFTAHTSAFEGGSTKRQINLQVVASSAAIEWAVVMNSVSPTTTGLACSVPPSPSLTRQTDRRSCTFPTLISVRGEDRTPS